MNHTHLGNGQWTNELEATISHFRVRPSRLTILTEGAFEDAFAPSHSHPRRRSSRFAVLSERGCQARALVFETLDSEAAFRLSISALFEDIPMESVLTRQV